MRDLLGLCGALVIAVSAIYYFIDVLRGDTRPQRASWSVWAAVGLLGFGTADAGGAGPGAWAGGVDAIACVATFLLSLRSRYGKPGGLPVDPYLAVAGVAGVALWRFGPLSINAAAVCAVACELPALWPTLREAWHQPRAESLLSWGADVAGHSLALAAVARFSLAALAYPVYLVLAHFAVSAVLLLRRRHSRRIPVEWRVAAQDSRAEAELPLARGRG